MIIRFLRRCLAAVHRLCGVYKAYDLRPHRDIERVDARHFRSLGPDPQFRVRHRLRPGYYLMLVALDVHQPHTQTRLYLDFGQGESEEDSLALTVRAGHLSRRFVHLPRAAWLRFDPMSAAGEFELQRFQLQWVPAALALHHIRRRLDRSHPRHAAQVQGDEATLWADYCALFETRSDGLITYDEWMHRVEPRLSLPLAQQAARARAWDYRPTFSVLLPVWNPNPEHLRACLDSVCAQTYPQWELCVADDASTNPQVRHLLTDYAGRDTRIRLLCREINGHISRASNSALSLARGDFVVLLDHDDVLAPQALFAVAQALQQRPDAQLLYSDEDKLDESGRRCDPFFKPDWSPDLFYSQNYLSHLGVYRRELVQSLGGFRVGLEGSQDYDLALRCVARIQDPAQIVHIPQVLYHWRRTPQSTSAGHASKDYATPAAVKALQSHFDETHPGVQVSVIEPGLYRSQWPLPERLPKVSIIIPTRDACEILRACVESVLALTRYPNLELIIVDNQSTCPETLAYLAQLAALDPVRVLHHDQPFNYSAINNEAARAARGELLCLLNNDVTVISQDWLTEMVRHAVRPDVGCVGAKLYYPDDTVQHAGVVLGIGGVAGHSHKYFERRARGYFSRLRVVHNVSAVTGAALVVRKSVFEQVGGLDEEGLSVAFNDVDFCLKVSQAGYRHVWTPFAELYHHESKTRGSDLSPEKAARFAAECALMQQRWGAALASDPCYNPHLSRTREDYTLHAEWLGPVPAAEATPPVAVPRAEPLPQPSEHREPETAVAEPH